jgi:ABC-type sugar transport system permease subunit
MPKKTFSPIFLQIPVTVIIWSLVGFVLVWLIYSFLYSTSPGGQPTFAALNNLITMFSDSRLFNAVLRTIYYAGVGTVIEVLLGMLVALALVNFISNTTVRFVVLMIFLTPMALSEAIASHIWLMLLTPQGYINSMLRSLGLPPVGWLSESMALTSLILADVWQWTSLPLLLIYAARVSIPQELYEMASLERLSAFKTFQVVTWPYIRNAVVVAALLRFIFMYITIDKILLITFGGPGFATETLGYYIWMQSFSYRNISYAATLSLATLIGATIVAYIFWRMITRK